MAKGKTIPFCAHFFDELSDGIQLFAAEAPYALVYANAACRKLLELEVADVPKCTLADFLEQKPSEQWIKAMLAKDTATKIRMFMKEHAEVSGHLSVLKMPNGQQFIRNVLHDNSSEVKAFQIQSLYLNIMESSPSLLQDSIESYYGRIFHEFHTLFGVSHLAVIYAPKAKATVSRFLHYTHQRASPEAQAAEKRMCEVLAQDVLERQNAILVYAHRIQKIIKAHNILMPQKTPTLWIGVPIPTLDEQVGVICFYSYEKNAHYSYQDIEVLEFAARQIASALDKSKHQQKLAQQYAYMRAVTESSSHQIWFLNRDLRFTFFNSHFSNAFADMVGQFPKQGGAMFDQLATREDSRVIAMWQQRYALVFQGHVSDFSIRAHHHLNQKPIWYHVFLRPIYSQNGHIEEVSAIAHNTTHQKQVEKALKRNEEKFRTIFERFQDLYVVFTSSGEVTLVSPSVKEVTGYGLEELVASPIAKWMHMQKSPEVMYQEVKKAGRLMNIEGVLRTKQGRRLYCIGHLKAARTSTNELAVEAVFRDISQLKKTSQALEKAKNMAEDLLKVKQNFLANISHEIRTPINGMLGMLTLLEHTPLSAEQQEYVRLSKKSSETLLNLLNDILYLSKIEAGKLTLQPQCVAVQDMFDKLLSLFSSEARLTNHLFKWSISSEVPSHIYIDETRLLQVMSNLLSNAFKFSAADKPVYLDMAVVRRSGANYTFSVRVKDEGIGVSQANQSRLFKSFSQVEDGMKKQFSGTGLGLYISKLLVQQMGGQINVESEPMVGSVFSFTFQARQMEPHAVTVRAVTSPQDNLADIEPHLLIVDDNAINRRVSSELLRKSGCQVLEADHGDAAIVLAKKHALDLILMDIQMPVKDGIETTRDLRAQIPNLPPVIAMTAYSMEEDKERFLAQGMDDYIAKPIQMPALVSMIRYWVSQYRRKGSSVSSAEWTQKDASPSASQLTTEMDWKRIEGLIHYGGCEMVQESFACFKGELKGLYQACVRALEQKDAAAMGSAAHNIKGTAAMVGLKGIADTAKGMEMAAKEKKWRHLTNKLKILKEKFDKFELNYPTICTELLSYEKDTLS